MVDEAGVLRAPPLTGSLGSVVIAQGRVDVLGRIEGSYTIGDGLGEDREGEFAGSLETRALSAPSPELDGLYDLSFIREGEEVAVTTLQVHGGRFSVEVVNRDGLRFSAEGFVSEDGTVTLTSGRGTDFAVIAEGHIDADTHRIEGLYAVGSLVGDVKGRRAD